MFHVSVLIATRNRASLLSNMLSSLARQQLNRDTRIEVIVVDNGSTDETSNVLRQHQERFELVPLYENTPGKSRALNRALEVAKGELLVFADDDITLSPMWLESLNRCSHQYKAARAFCGPIVPNFPPSTPDWIQNHPSTASMFARFEPNIPEGPLPEPLLPFGCNFSVRSCDARGHRFRLDLGPSAANGPLFNEDTEFVRRFRQHPDHIIYVPTAMVRHHISLDRITLPGISERAFHLGRGQVADLLIPNFEYGLLAMVATRVSSSPSDLYEKAALANFYCGQLYQFHSLGNRSFDHEYTDAFLSLDIDHARSLLGPSAQAFFDSFWGQRS